ncbi:hypothetical protein EVA_20014 [gut metagenome]|uniref:Uncharacterized protein n=1 Tax=gut metagenome TaxID=749906 RepID=J9FWY3_9ZZZZ
MEMMLISLSLNILEISATTPTLSLAVILIRVEVWFMPIISTKARNKSLREIIPHNLLSVSITGSALKLVL